MEESQHINYSLEQADFEDGNDSFNSTKEEEDEEICQVSTDSTHQSLSRGENEIEEQDDVVVVDSSTVSTPATSASRTIVGTADIAEILGGASSSKKAKMTTSLKENAAGIAPAPAAAAPAVAAPQRPVRAVSGARGKPSTVSVSVKVLKAYFPPNPDGSTTFVCKLCTRVLTLFTNERMQWGNARDHLRNCHAGEYARLLQDEFEAAAKNERAEANVVAQRERARLLEETESLAVGKRSVSCLDLLMESDQNSIPALCNFPAFNASQRKRIQYVCAYWVAKDNLSQNTFEKPGFRSFAEAIGLNIKPCAETIRKSQAELAERSLSKTATLLASVVDFSPLPLISIQTDVWSAHDGTQQMGVRITFMNPHLLTPMSYYLPLEAATGGSLNAAAEAELVKKNLMRVSLSPDCIYTQTTDSATVALLSAPLNNITGLRCAAHQTALALTDCVTIHDSRDDSFVDKDFDAKGDKVAQLLFGVCARSAHFARSALASRQLADWQSKNNKHLLKFIQWSPTRWTGVFEALLRDTTILQDGGDKFLVEYARNANLSPKMKQNIVPKEGSVQNALLILSILKPLYDLTLALQADNLTLAAAYLSILDCYEKMSTSHVEMVDINGKETSPRSLDSMHPSFQIFRDKLRNQIRDRLLGQVDDEVWINIALDPYSYNLLALLADGYREDFDDLDADDVPVELHGSLPLVRAGFYALRNIQTIENSERFTNSMRIVLAKLRTKDAAAEAPTLQNRTAEDTKKEILQISQSSAAAGAANLTQKLQQLRRLRLDGGSAQRADSSLQMTQMVTEELAAYKKARANLPEAETTIEFWRKNRSIFPSLYHRFLASSGARPCTARLESYFSIASGLVPPHRASMSTATLNNLLILKTSTLTPRDFLFAANESIEKEKEK